MVEFEAVWNPSNEMLERKAMSLAWFRGFIHSAARFESPVPSALGASPKPTSIGLSLDLFLESG